MVWVTFLLALALALVHTLAGRIRALSVIPRSRWLSLAGGASVAYVFIHLLPELSRSQQQLEEVNLVRYLEHHAYLLALIGLAVFYALERLAARSQRQSRTTRGADQTEPRVFWIHTGGFALYNVLIGYLLLHREQPGTRSLILFFTAMALHFLVNDYGLRRAHKSAYEHTGRWVLGAAVLAGWAAGIWGELTEPALAGIIAFLAGGVIMNVLKEELPEERDSSIWAFVVGAAAYTAVLLAQ